MILPVQTGKSVVSLRRNRRARQRAAVPDPFHSTLEVDVTQAEAAFYHCALALRLEAA